MNWLDEVLISKKKRIPIIIITSVCGGIASVSFSYFEENQLEQYYYISYLFLLVALIFAIPLLNYFISHFFRSRYIIGKFYNQQAVIDVIVYLMHLDGKPSEIVQRTFNDFIYRNFPKKYADETIEVFVRRSKLSKSINPISYKRIAEMKPKSKLIFLNLLCKVAIADRLLTQNKRNFLVQFCDKINLHQNVLETILERYSFVDEEDVKFNHSVQNKAKVQNKEYFQALGLQSYATEEEIKKAYRNLVQKYHPDKLVHQSDKEKSIAKAKFETIQLAYEALKKQMEF